MKFIAKFLLTVIAVPILVLLVLSINIRFQLLSPEFWTTTLEKGGVYSKISTVIAGRLESRVVAEGGTERDVSILTNIISPLNVKDFLEKNIQSVLVYANGKIPQLEVFVPPLQLNGMGSSLVKTNFFDFLREYNISGINQEDVEIVSRFGLWSWLLFGLTIFLSALILCLKYLLITPGKHLGGVGTTFILSGLLITGLFFVIDYENRFLTNNFVESTNVGTSLAAVIAPPILGEIAEIWIIAGVILSMLGVVLFFLKKPAKNK